MNTLANIIIGMLIALLFTIIGVIVYQKLLHGLPELPDISPGKPSIPSKTPEEKEVPSDVITNAIKYTYNTLNALAWSSSFFRDVIRYGSEVETSSKKYSAITRPSFDAIKVILNKGITDIVKYQTDTVGSGSADNCDLNDSGSCAYYEALLKMDDSVSFEIAHSVGSRVYAVYQQIPTIVSKSSIDALTKEMYTYINSVKDALDTGLMKFPKKTKASILDSLHSLTHVADELVNRSNDADESAKRMLSAGNRLATFTTNI